ncbi:hypothetical protein JG688_00007230 [Phytophthora aleatoria]|uniref:Uncharacterized protein n=1 Tax=Phytophthora aleatoria TaxID=2496075 RepID=A0A8J5ILK6_9STRA|nr:hypothetical protein JG688_00007230 [Phytophthora aleatoria]
MPSRRSLFKPKAWRKQQQKRQKPCSRSRSTSRPRSSPPKSPFRRLPNHSRATR